MHRFATDREALDFLADRIAAEAKRENISLSDLERKILYFSETSWTLPEMTSVSASFDQNYDQDEYERKIASLIAQTLPPNTTAKTKKSKKSGTLR